MVERTPDNRELALPSETAEEAVARTPSAVPVHANKPVPSSLAEEERRTKLPKTTGEWVYDNIQFWFVKGLILGATALIGYYARFGKDTNVIRKFQKWCMKAIAEPLATAGGKAGESLEKSIGGKTGQWIGDKIKEVMAVFGGAFASTMVLFHGGNLMAPVVQWFENNRQGIVADANRRWGKPEEVALGDEKFKDTPKQTFGDVIVGRITAWLTVFASFFTAFLVIGKMKHVSNPAMYKLDYFEEFCSRAVSGFGKKSEFAHIPMNKELHELAKETPALFAGKERNLLMYKVSRILALDIYATSMGIIVWNLTSRISARTREHGESFFTGLKQALFGRGEAKADTVQEAKQDIKLEAEQETKQYAAQEVTVPRDPKEHPAEEPHIKHHAAEEKPRHHREHPASSSHGEAVKQQRKTAEAHAHHAV